MFQLSNPPQASSSSGSVGEVGANVLACIPLSAQDGGSASGFVTILNNLYDDPERSHNAALYHRNESINGEWGRRMQLKSAVDLITKAEPYDSVSLMMSVTLKGKINLDASTAAKVSAYPLTLRMQAGYDHSYYFISTFMADHLQHHRDQLN